MIRFLVRICIAYQVSAPVSHNSRHRCRSRGGNGCRSRPSPQVSTCWEGRHRYLPVHISLLQLQLPPPPLHQRHHLIQNSRRLKDDFLRHKLPTSKLTFDPYIMSAVFFNHDTIITVLLFKVTINYYLAVSCNWS